MIFVSGDVGGVVLRVDVVYDDVFVFVGNYVVVGVGWCVCGDCVFDFVLLFCVVMGDWGYWCGVGVERVVGGLFGYVGGVRDGLVKNVL